MERARQLVGEVLLYVFVVVLLTGGLLAFHYVPSGREVSYTGVYEPLRGVRMSAAYHSILDITMDVRGGLLLRQLHYRCTILFAVGIVVWALLGRYRYALPALGLSGLGALAGFGSADDLLSGTMLGRVPVPFWYGLHLVAALAVGAVLVISSRREAAERPRTLRFVALALGLTCLAILAS